MTTSLKNWLIKELSKKLNVKEEVLERVVNHQFESATVALSHHNSIEFSGFGKLFFNRKRAIKKMEKLLSQKRGFERIASDESLPVWRRKNAEFKLKTTLDNIEYLKPKMNED